MQKSLERIDPYIFLKPKQLNDIQSPNKQKKIRDESHHI